MGIFDRFKKKDLLTSRSFGKTDVEESLSPSFNPSMYLIPLNHKKAPVVLQRNPSDNIMLVAVTDNGKISAFPADSTVVDSINERIGQRFPRDLDPNGTPVNHYLAVGVMMMSNQKTGSAKFIFEVCGFNQGHGGGIDLLYETLTSACKTQVGSIEYVEIEKVLSSGSMGEWINQSISFLKNQLNWPEYVQRALAMNEQAPPSAPLT